jgi:hypothetical protein
MAADFLCEVEDLLMQLRHGRNRRADDIPEGNISYERKSEYNIHTCSHHHMQRGYQGERD